MYAKIFFSLLYILILFNLLLLILAHKKLIWRLLNTLTVINLA